MRWWDFRSRLVYVLGSTWTKDYYIDESKESSSWTRREARGFDKHSHQKSINIFYHVAEQCDKSFTLFVDSSFKFPYFFASLFTFKILGSLNWPGWHSSDHDEIWSWLFPDEHVSCGKWSFSCMIMSNHVWHRIALKSKLRYQTFSSLALAYCDALRRKKRPKHVTFHLWGSLRPLHHRTNNSPVLVPFRHSLIRDADTFLPPDTSSMLSPTLQYISKTCVTSPSVMQNCDEAEKCDQSSNDVFFLCFR